MNKKQSGFAPLMIIIILVIVVGTIGVTSWKVVSLYHHQRLAATSRTANQSAPRTTKVATTTATQVQTTANTPATGTKSTTQSTAYTPNTVAKLPAPTAFALSYLLNSGAPVQNIPAGVTSYTMTCYKGGGSGSSNTYVITAETTNGNVQVSMCYYQSFEATLVPNQYARLNLADGNYIDVPLKGGGLDYQPTCSNGPANGPIVPVDINNGGGAIVNVQLCSGYKFMTSPVY